MEKLKYIVLEQLINEGRLEDMIKKYSNTDENLTDASIRKLSENDPSGNNKYLDWMCNQHKVYGFQPIIDAINCFHENVNRINEKNITAAYGSEILPKIKLAPKDIGSYPDLPTLKILCEYFEENLPRTTSRVKIYEDDRWLVVSPLTHKASCEYGAFSSWCVSTSNVDYYERYTRDGILVFFIDKKGTSLEKKDANVYKFAVNIKTQSQALEDWEWYSMSDARIDSHLMMNLVPKNLLEAASKYSIEVLENLKKNWEINEQELTEKSAFWTKTGDYYYIFLKENNSYEFLKKYDTLGRLLATPTIIKNGVPVIRITYGYGVPELYILSMNWNFTQGLVRWDNETNTVTRSAVINELNSRWSNTREIANLIGTLNETDRNIIYDMYIDRFNKAKVTTTRSVNVERLKIGDVIMYAPVRRGREVPVKVVSVANKSIGLENGKRVAKTGSNYKDKVTGIIQIVEDPVAPVTNESRWIRKRII
jgi:hypothetical protein